MNLVTGMQEVEALKPVAKNQLSAMSFDSGKRNADFNPPATKSRRIRSHRFDRRPLPPRSSVYSL